MSQPYHFRLEVHGERTELSRDGRTIASQPIEYTPTPDWHWLIYDLPSESQTETSTLKLAEGTFANRGEYRNGCSLFPSSGVAVLRKADGDFADSSLPLKPRSGQLGDACGYQRVEQKQGTSAADVVTRHVTSGKQQFRIWIVPLDGSPTEVMLAESPTNRPNARMPMPLLRRTATRTRFATVLEPVRQAEFLQAVRAEKGTDANRMSLVLEWSTGSDRVLLP